MQLTTSPPRSMSLRPHCRQERPPGPLRRRVAARRAAWCAGSRLRYHWQLHGRLQGVALTSSLAAECARERYRAAKQQPEGQTGSQEAAHADVLAVEKHERCQAHHVPRSALKIHINQISQFRNENGLCVRLVVRPLCLPRKNMSVARRTIFHGMRHMMEFQVLFRFDLACS